MIGSVQTVLLMIGTFNYYTHLCQAVVNPPLPRWGGNSSTLAWSAFVNMTDPADRPSHPFWQFKYYYDATQAAPRSRYVLSAGQDDVICGSFCGAGQVPQYSPCTMINSADGLYIQWAEGTRSNCCNCTMKVINASGAPNFVISSDWIRKNDPAYQGRSTVDGVEVDEWVVLGLHGPNHYFARSDRSQEFVRFYEQKHHVMKQWDVVSIDQSQPDQSLFDVPVDCSAECH